MHYVKPCISAWRFSLEAVFRVAYSAIFLLAIACFLERLAFSVRIGTFGSHNCVEVILNNGNHCMCA